MNASIKVDILHKTITISQKFYRASMVPHSAEFEELLRLQRELTDYSIVVAVAQRHPNANKGINPTYDQMRRVAMLHGDETGLHELEQVIEMARLNQRSPYNFVRRWFMGRYSNECFVA